jgi:3-hydroxybutyryl-CoA dehydrogenase
VIMIDIKQRTPEQFAKLEADALSEVKATLTTMTKLGMLNNADAEIVIGRVSVIPAGGSAAALATAGLVFEGVPEVVDLKREVLGAASHAVGPDVIIASTTSTILVDDLSGAVENPKRFLNAHWLNPAYLIPLVEIAPGAATEPAIVTELKALLEGIGKVPVVCAATPGFIVPRIQTLAMNEAARMVGEGVASAEEIDKAIRYGFGFRYAVLGLLEFIDWGGGDILYYASRYLEGALGSDRYRAPEVIARNMEEGHIGLRTGAGFLDYSGMDMEAYREGRLSALVDMLRHFKLARPPVLD